MSLKINSRRLSYFTFLFWLSLLVAPGPGCTKEPALEAAAPTIPAAPIAPAASSRLLSSTLIGEYTPSTLAGRVPDLPIVSALTQYSIRVYKLTYTTPNTDGRPVTASGAVLVPVASQPLPLLSYQHGTISPKDEARAPSYYRSGGEVWTAISVLASSGYLVVAPDYIGYGASKSLPHPYEHAASLASASLNMMRAAREFCKQEKIQLNDKNFLLGYSEGGFATLALHKLIEEQHATEFTVTASAPGAGAYNKSAFANYILKSDKPLNFLGSYVWVLDTYNRVYNINRPYTGYFQEPWASQLQANPFAKVPEQAKELFTEPFRAGVLNKTDQPITAAFRDNDIYDWRPRAPLALFHGTADDYVPFFNSENAYKAMRARGATQVELHPIKDGNHFSAVPQYTLEALAFFGEFQEIN
ncbi:alpha/beta hydrolase family protein [Hymenobacter qilianensis]|uniref:alpha/beta hydrolase family protein n=1 Tax=Hymenobacter qilianensis TaxID=1385715 RepID=UPI0016690AD7|nr:alpha/beta fold hydrolase [Hymenobacter qilianensis]